MERSEENSFRSSNSSDENSLKEKISKLKDKKIEKADFLGISQDSISVQEESSISSAHNSSKRDISLQSTDSKIIQYMRTNTDKLFIGDNLLESNPTNPSLEKRTRRKSRLEKGGSFISLEDRHSMKSGLKNQKPADNLHISQEEINLSDSIEKRIDQEPKIQLSQTSSLSSSISQSSLTNIRSSNNNSTNKSNNETKGSSINNNSISVTTTIKESPIKGKRLDLQQAPTMKSDKELVYP